MLATHDSTAGHTRVWKVSDGLRSILFCILLDFSYEQPAEFKLFMTVNDVSITEVGGYFLNFILPIT